MVHTSEEFLARWIQVVHGGFWNIVFMDGVFYILPGKDHEARINHWAFMFEIIQLGNDTTIFVPEQFFIVDRI
jgi:hypothetical protein